MTLRITLQRGSRAVPSVGFARATSWLIIRTPSSDTSVQIRRQEERSNRCCDWHIIAICQQPPQPSVRGLHRHWLIMMTTYMYASQSDNLHEARLRWGTHHSSVHYSRVYFPRYCNKAIAEGPRDAQHHVHRVLHKDWTLSIINATVIGRSLTTLGDGGRVLAINFKLHL